MSSSMENINDQTESTTINHTDTQNSGSLEVKYGNTPNKGTDSSQIQPQTKQEDQEPTELLFFNYHEYMVQNYTSLETGLSDIHDQALIVTHFPSYIQHPSTSHELKPKRIVRIPRTFTVKGIIYPQFSAVLPGYESAAIKSENSNDETRGFIPRGIYEGELFGITSESPLSNYFNEEEFELLMGNINTKVQACYGSFHFWNIVEFILDMLTFWLLSDVFKFQSKRVSRKLLIYQINFLLTKQSKSTLKISKLSFKI